MAVKFSEGSQSQISFWDKMFVNGYRERSEKRASTQFLQDLNSVRGHPIFYSYETENVFFQTVLWANVKIYFLLISKYDVMIEILLFWKNGAPFLPYLDAAETSRIHSVTFFVRLIRQSRTDSFSKGRVYVGMIFSKFRILVCVQEFLYR